MNAEANVERVVLGALLLGGDWQTAAVLGADDFTDRVNRSIYAAMADVVEDGAPLDVVTVATRMQAAGTLPEDGMSCLADLFESAPTAANLGHYVTMIRDYAKRRRAAAALVRAQKELAAGGDPSEVLAGAQTALLAEAPTSGDPLAAVLAAAVAAAEQTRDEVARSGDVGAPTGFPFIDSRTGGFRPGRLWVVSGRPGAGKSAWALQAAIHAARRGHRVGMVSLEMDTAECGIRILAQQLDIPATWLSQGDARVVTDMLSHPKRAALSALPMTLDTRSARLGDIGQRISAWSRDGCKAVIVDYLQRIEGGDGNNRNEQLGHITRRLKRLAMELGVCVVVLCALNRETERNARRPVLADLRESGDIEYDADIVLALRRITFEDAPVAEVEIGLLKNRTGRVGWARDPYDFDAKHQVFRERADPSYQEARA